MRRSLLPVLGLVWMTLVAAQAQARDLKFITIDVAPWAYAESASTRLSGVFPDVVRELERRTGHRIAMSLHPFARIDRELEAGAQDCTIIVWNDQRARVVRKGELVSDHPIGVIAAKGSRLAGYDDLRGLKSISVLRGLSLGARFDHDPAIAKEFDTDYQTGLRKIAHGRVDAIAGAVPTILYLAAQMGLNQHLGERLSLGSMELVLQCSLKSPHLDLMDQFNRAIRDMRDDGTLERIFKENYFS
ncbi:hypothetical protein A6A04_02070 [Paramagnetospirillum marisnigri]|uniref:Solute-binding protein family 3/N-terminal domain-containing protein n=1 Tax=Paramagnetospirillum marisnigri TaxID=1285242 RepID=A0A178MQ55_9PROT|nr:transporter substrate-binding domain-containing protein [Paramagnetospirillum marisnigri]OAN50215.1 hypothetical protein A6A04_02070 [Paramagnetospirillum marisnigri]